MITGYCFNAIKVVLNLSKRRAPVIGAGCLLTMSSLCAYSQLDFRSGYVITPAGDTVQGLVAYRGVKNNSKSAVFKKTAKAKATVFGPADIAGYGIHGANLFKALELPPGTPYAGRAFAKVLTQGHYDLYRYRHFFLLDADDSLIFLPPPKNERVGGPDSKIVKRAKRYIGILNYVMLDCQVHANEAAYSDGDLVEVINRYNSCRKGVPEGESRGLKLNVDFMIFGGYSASLMSYRYFRKIPFRSNTVVGGGGIEFSYPRNFDRISVSAELIFFKNFYQGYYEVDFPSEVVRQDVFYHVSSIQFPFGMRYNFRRPDDTPYIRAGLSWQPLLKSSVRTIQENESLFGEITTTEFEGGYEFKSPKGFWMSLGYNRQTGDALNLFVELRYGMTQGFLGSPIIDDSRNRSFNFLAGLRF